MGWPQVWGLAVFIGVPGLLCVAGALANRGGDLPTRLLGFTVGTDGRLSLSRFQAFLWTLIIFGSYAGAMCIHTTISSGSPAAILKANDEAKAAADKIPPAKLDYQKAADAAKTAEADKRSADLAAATDEVTALDRAKDPTTAAQQIADDKKKASDSRIKKDVADKLSADAEQAMADAKVALDKAQSEADAASARANSFAWVKIPDALLLLAGIAISSGVFSSLIAVVSSEGKTATITQIRKVAKAVPEGQAADVPWKPINPNNLVLAGTNLGDGGRVRFALKGIGKVAARILSWKPDGTEIILDVADGQNYSTLIVDTPNGKASYQVTGTTPNLTLGSAKSHFEFADLFRDDKNPGTMDLMKFQMFGWTVIAIAIYVYLFLMNLNSEITSLPNVDSSIVTLTGVSQAGYLAGKGVSNAPPSTS
jgi:hypothetical protein